MKLIIDIPDKMYQNAKTDMLCGSEIIVNAIKNGTQINQESKPEWIPVSDEIDIHYPCLATDKFGQMFIPMGVVCIGKRWYESKNFNFDVDMFLKGEEINLDGEKVYLLPREIIAWQPLPRPYQSEVDMTREELKEYIIHERELNMIPHHTYIALIDGIDELEPCEDCISREDAIKTVRNHWGEMLNPVNLKIQDELMNLPSVKQEPKQGHWIWDAEKTYCKCSECGIGMGHTEFDFCPNCGCRMSEVEQ